MSELTAPVLPEVHLNLYNKKNPVEVPIVENRIVTSGASPNIIRHITFDVSGTELEGNVKAGQSLGILPPGEDERGKPHPLRLYSVASPSMGDDGQGRHYSTTVKRLIAENPETQQLHLGVCSNYLAGLKPGSKVSITGPSGKRFLLPEHPEDFNFIFIATGTGIAPFRGMMMELLNLNPKINAALLFGCPYRTDVLYESYFNSIARENPHFLYYKSISREDRRPDGTRKYVQYEFLDHESELDPLLRMDNTLIYICGLKGMEFGIYQTLAQKGFENYLDIKDGFDIPPEKWRPENIKRKVKPGYRVFEETY